MLELIDLTDDAETRVGALSGGQRRRVDVAIGIIGKPDILFLDEPTTGAGVENLTSTGTTVVLTTHYIDEADHFADRVIVLSGGRIVADATPHELRTRGGPSTIRYPLVSCVEAADLPSGLLQHLDGDGRMLVIRSTDISVQLRELVYWADRHDLDLAGLEIGPPSLAEAYLAAIGQPLAGEVSANV